MLIPKVRPKKKIVENICGASPGFLRGVSVASPFPVCFWDRPAGDFFSGQLASARYNRRIPALSCTQLKRTAMKIGPRFTMPPPGRRRLKKRKRTSRKAKTSTIPAEGLVTREQAMAFLNVSLRTIDNLIADKKLRSIKIGHARRVQCASLWQIATEGTAQ
jgi:excisionase family DNA binding protein